jgi:pimeloyl-ACP methyl ester carboxylesterase
MRKISLEKQFTLFLVASPVFNSLGVAQATEAQEMVRVGPIHTLSVARRLMQGISTDFHNRQASATMGRMPVRGEQGPYCVGTVTSGDGTIIGYRQLGSGPGLILVHGGMMGSQNFMKLGHALADTFTVYIPDRRGRGLSGLHGKYSLEKEAEDMSAIVVATGAGNIFGLSSGAIVTLQTALKVLAIKNVALYEPPIPVGGYDHTRWVDQYKKEIAERKFGAALLTVADGTNGPTLLTRLRFITAPLLNLAIKVETNNVKGDDVSLRDLILTMHYDPQAVMQSRGLIERAKELRANVLLLGGSKSPDYLRMALDSLQGTLRQVTRVKLKGVGHLAADNGGKPRLVAQELKNFLLSHCN